MKNLKLILLSSLVTSSGAYAVNEAVGVSPTGVISQDQIIADDRQILDITEAEKQALEADYQEKVQEAIQAQRQALEEAARLQQLAEEDAEALIRESQTAQDLADLQDAINAGEDVDTGPQPDDTNFVLSSSPVSGTTPWNQSITLSAYHQGETGDKTFYAVNGQPCQVGVTSGLVVLGSPIPAGQTSVTCKVYARNQRNAITYWQTDPITLTFTKQCNDEGLPLTASAPSTGTVGQPVQITASGGGCVGHVGSDLNDAGFIQFYETDPFCTVDENGSVSASQAGNCSITVTKASEGAINPASQQIIEISFTDPNADGALQVSASSTSLPSGGTATLQVTGGGSGGATFRHVQPVGKICTVNTSGVVQAYGNTTCEVYASKNGVEAGPVCINFGQGSVVPPPGCRAAGFSDGPFQITNPLGAGTVNATHSQVAGYLHEIGYRGGNGTDLGTVTFSLAEANANCQVLQTTVSASTDTVCKVRAYSGGLAQYSTNLICVPFGSATLSSACELESAGGVAAADFDFTFDGSDSGHALESEIVLTGINLGEGGTADWEMTDAFPHECIFNGGNPTKTAQTEVTLIHHANRGPGVCGVRARRNGFDADWVTKCFAFGDYQITDRENCTGVAPVPTLMFAADTTTTNVNGTITYTATLSRPLGVGESFEILPVTVDGATPSSSTGCFFGGNQERPYFSSASQSSHQRTLLCTSDGTYKLKARFNWADETIEESVCVRYGEGSLNSECPDLSYVAPAPTIPAAPSDSITFDLLESYPLDERITLIATNAGDSPRWLVTRTPIFNSRSGWPDASLVSCTQFTPTNEIEQDMQVSYYPAICKVTLQHSDDRSNEISRCVNFGDVNVPSNSASYVNSQCGTSY